MKRVLTIIVIVMAVLVGCQSNDTVKIAEYETWQDIEEAGKGQTVTILMWGGNESINQFMDGYVSTMLLDRYDIKLNRVPMNAPEYLAKLINEKKTNVDEGTADLVWINAENFRTAKEGNLLDGPITNLLPNLKKYYDKNASDLSMDSGIPIEGYEGIWGRAQLVFTSEEGNITSYDALLNYAKANPGRITYPRIPDDFVGVAFVRNAYYELTGHTDIFQSDLSKEEFVKLSQPVMAYFQAIKPYLWNQGEVYPASQAQLDELFKNGEVDMTMGFEIGKTAGLIASGVYDDSVESFVFETGTIGNSHYLAVPFNAPQKAGALLVLDFLQSPQAQVEKMKSEVWGDMPAFDVEKVDTAILESLGQIESKPGSLTIERLTEHRNPEMKAKYIDWIKEIWIENLVN